jgi:serine phosphatase RsbU (regulator of sigma subunit)/CHASE2 domain-containing sensor protein
MTASRSASEAAPRADALKELGASARRRIQAAGLVAALVAALAVLWGGAGLRQSLFDAYQRLSPTPDVSRRVHVVVIDAESLREVGGWPWTRFYLARLVEEISARGASVIGLDLLFAEPDRLAPSDFAGLYPELGPDTAAEIRALPSMDAVFARVIGRSPVVLARAGVAAGSFDRLDGAGAALPPEAQVVGKPPAALPTYPAVVANIPILDGAPLGHGLVNGEPDGDGVVRRVPLLARAGGQLVPGFAAELVRVAERADALDLERAPGGGLWVRIGARRVSALPDGRLLLRFGDWRSTQTTSAVDLLRRGLPADLFKDQIVLVGLASAGTADVASTPRANQVYGVYVQAQAVDAILRGAGLHRPRWTTPLEWGIGLALALASVAGIPRAPLSLVIAGSAGAVATAVGGSLLAFQNNILLDPIPMLSPAAVGAATLVMLLFVEGRRVQARLRSALEDERLAAARISGELAAASEIQSGMLLPRQALGRISPEIEVDAVLHPARTVGGDLYDAFRLEDGRLCFLVGDVTGKGVPASLFMALSKALSRSLLMRRATSLDAALAGINAELSRDNGQNMALSLLVGVLDPRDGGLDLCCAGHENPFIVDAAGGVRELRLEGGPPLCVVEDFPYPVERHRLAPGETFVALTDGVTEAQDPQGRLFDRSQLLEALREGAAAADLRGMVDTLVDRVRAHEAGAEPSDDLTILAVRRGPTGG